MFGKAYNIKKTKFPGMATLWPYVRNCIQEFSMHSEEFFFYNILVVNTVQYMHNIYLPYKHNHTASFLL